MKRITTVMSAVSVVMLAASCKRSTYAEPPASSYTAARFALTTTQTDTVAGAMVSPEFFTTSGVRPLLGRFFLPVEYEREDNPVVVISNELWRRRFGAAPQLIGERVQMNGQSVVIVGVAPPDFGWPAGAAFWRPRVPR